MYNKETNKYEVIIEIGKQYSSSIKDLIDTLLHEELEARILLNIHGRELFYEFNELANKNEHDFRHEYIQRVINRYLQSKGIK